jgi:hypothetical protein
MKKTAMLALCLLCLTGFLGAQEIMRLNQITGGLSLPNIPALAYQDLGDGGGSSSGPFTLGLSYPITGNGKLTGGLVVSAGSAESGTLYDEFDLPYTFKASMITVIGRWDYNWSLTDRSCLYSGIGLGYSFVSSAVEGDIIGTAVSEPAMGFAWHLTGIGAKYMLGKHFGLYGELGFGHLGILNSGILVAF